MNYLYITNTQHNPEEKVTYNWDPDWVQAKNIRLKIKKENMQSLQMIFCQVKKRDILNQKINPMHPTL